MTTPIRTRWFVIATGLPLRAFSRRPFPRRLRMLTVSMAFCSSLCLGRGIPLSPTAQPAARLQVVLARIAFRRLPVREPVKGGGQQDDDQIRVEGGHLVLHRSGCSWIVSQGCRSPAEVAVDNARDPRACRAGRSSPQAAHHPVRACSPRAGLCVLMSRFPWLSSVRTCRQMSTETTVLLWRFSRKRKSARGRGELQGRLTRKVTMTKRGAGRRRACRTWALRKI